MNRLRKRGLVHSSRRGAEAARAEQTSHIVAVADCFETLRRIPSRSIQLVICDPPYNINVAAWDDLAHYVDWAGQWLSEVERVLLPSGNFVLFGGLQYQGEAGSGDLLSLMSWMRQHSRMLLANLLNDLARFVRLEIPDQSVTITLRGQMSRCIYPALCKYSIESVICKRIEMRLPSSCADLVASGSGLPEIYRRR